MGWEEEWVKKRNGDLRGGFEAGFSWDVGFRFYIRVGLKIRFRFDLE